jgi:hypothetical protein
MSKNGAEFLDFRRLGRQKTFLRYQKTQQGKIYISAFFGERFFYTGTRKKFKNFRRLRQISNVVFTKDIEPKKENKEEAVNE